MAKEYPSYAKVSKVQKLVLELDEFKGQIPTETISIPQTGSDETAEVLKFAVELVPMLKNAYTPAQKDLVACVTKLLAKYSRSRESSGSQTESVPDETDDVPQAPTAASSSKASSSINQTFLADRLARELNADPELVQKVVQGVFDEIRSGCLMAFIALSNGLHFLAKEHDKLPGHDDRIARIDKIREEYVGICSIK